VYGENFYFMHRAKDPIRYMPSDDTSLRDLKC